MKTKNVKDECKKFENVQVCLGVMITDSKISIIKHVLKRLQRYFFLINSFINCFDCFILFCIFI